MSDVNAILDRYGIKRCGDSSCIFGPRGGMMTNGGCRCGNEDPGAPSRPTRLSRQLAHAVTEQHAEIARLTAELSAEQDRRSDVIRERNEATEEARNATAANQILKSEVPRLEADVARLTAELAAARAELNAAASAGIERGRSWEATEWEAAFGVRSRREAVDKLRAVEEQFAAARAVPADVEAAIEATVDHFWFSSLEIDDPKAAEGTDGFPGWPDTGHGVVATLRAAISRAIADARRAGYAAASGDRTPVHAALGVSPRDATRAAMEHGVPCPTCGSEVTPPPTVGGLLAAAPHCSCTHEAGDSRCLAHPTCSECGTSTPRLVDECDAHRGPLTKGG